MQEVSEDFDTVIIAGMGGELIADILSRADDIQSKNIILNPMTHPEIARKWLYDNGFEIAKDIIVADGKHHYSALSAEFSGNVAEKSQIDYYLGAITDFSDKEYFEHLLVYLKNKQKSGLCLDDLIKAIEEKI